MALPTGTITMGDVNVELSKSATALISLNDSDVRTLAEKPTGVITMDDLRGKSAVTPTVAMSWGGGFFGEIGDGFAISRSSPVTVIGGITDWSDISAGYNFKVAVTQGGIAYAWGFGTAGRLGDGTTIGKSSPVTVVGGITNWKQVSAGANHVLAVTETGIAYAWGGDDEEGNPGHLGTGTTLGTSSPVTVIGGITDWKQVSASENVSGGVTESGILYNWGNSRFSSLGDGTTTYRSSPVTVLGGITNWKQIGVGRSHRLGITESGIAYAWGAGFAGLLGDGTTTYRSSPVTVVGGITNWKQVSAGRSHSLGITESGIAYGWGTGFAGRLGDGTSTSRSSPVTVVGGITNWAQVSAGRDHSLGIIESGNAYAWGDNNFGKLGIGVGSNTQDRSSPVTVVGGITSWSDISTEDSGSAGLFTT